MSPHICCYQEEESTPGICAGREGKHTVDPCVVVRHMSDLHPIVVYQEDKVQPGLQSINSKVSKHSMGTSLRDNKLVYMTTSWTCTTDDILNRPMQAKKEKKRLHC